MDTVHCLPVNTVASQITLLERSQFYTYKGMGVGWRGLVVDYTLRKVDTQALEDMVGWDQETFVSSCCSDTPIFNI